MSLHWTTEIEAKDFAFLSTLFPFSEVLLGIWKEAAHFYILDPATVSKKGPHARCC